MIKKRSIEEYNTQAKKMLTRPSESEEMADSLADMLLSSGAITLGGTGEEDRKRTPSTSLGRKSSRRNIRPRRGR